MRTDLLYLKGSTAKRLSCLCLFDLMHVSALMLSKKKKRLDVFCNSIETVYNFRNSLFHVFNVRCKAMTHISGIFIAIA